MNISRTKTLVFSAILTLAVSCQEAEIAPSVVSSPESNQTGRVESTYHSWLVGSAADVTTNSTGGTVLAGGSTDVDEAMRWMLQKANGGDVIVIRNAPDGAAPGAGDDGYNAYFYSELGVNVNSVETILMNGRSVAQNAEVIQKVRNAECVFFTGGDQFYYWDMIAGTGLADALDYLANTKGVPIGGTSAGCAIQGEYFFSAENSTVTSAEALRRPKGVNVTVRNNFLQTPYLQNTITDTHYDNPDRRGRHIAFMARMSVDYNVTLPKGIGVDEATAVCIETNGTARVFGAGTAFFLIQNTSSGTPERCVANKTLDWYRNRQAIEVYKINGTSNGSGSFNLNTWTSGTGGSWQYYYVDRGSLKVSY